MTSKLPEAIERLRLANIRLAAHLGEPESTLDVLPTTADEAPLDDVTERAKKFWDAQEAKSEIRRRRSVPPREVK